MASGKWNKELPLPAEFPVDGLNREHLAAAFGVSVRTIAKWLLKGLPRRGGGFFLPECIAWFGAQEAAKKGAGSSAGKGEGGDASPWLAAYRKERARMARMDRRRMQGALLPKDEMIRQFTARAFEFGRALLQLGRRFSAKVAAKCSKTVREVEAIHEKEARKVLEDYTRPIEIKEE